VKQKAPVLLNQKAILSIQLPNLGLISIVRWFLPKSMFHAHISLKAVPLPFIFVYSPTLRFTIRSLNFFSLSKL
jgi:hypothetical protein